MKSSTFKMALCAISALALPQIASASLLVGFHRFDDSTDIQTVLSGSATNYAATGFRGDLFKNGANSEADGGSIDGTYGDRDFGALNPASGDGYGRSLNAGDPVLRITNVTGSSVLLDALLFDAASISTGRTIYVTYQINGDGFKDLASGSLPGTAGGGVYGNFAIDLKSLITETFGPGDWIEFKFNGVTNGRIDNIALTSIPEAGNALACAGLLSGGIFFRSRRRAASRG